MPLQGPYGDIARATADFDNPTAWLVMREWVRVNVPRQPGWWRAASELIWEERHKLRTGTPTTGEKLAANLDNTNLDSLIAEDVAIAAKLASYG